MLLQAEPLYIPTQIYISGFGCFLATVAGSNVFSLEMAFDQRAVKTGLNDHTSSHLFGKVYLRDRNIFVQGATHKAYCLTENSLRVDEMVCCSTPQR